MPAAPPTSTKTSLQQCPFDHARERCPQLAGVEVGFRGAFAYITGELPDSDTLKLMRLGYAGSAIRWGFAIYLASKDGYERSVLPTGDFAGTPKTPSTAPAASTSTAPPPGPDQPPTNFGF